VTCVTCSASASISASTGYEHHEQHATPSHGRRSCVEPRTCAPRSSAATVITRGSVPRDELVTLPRSVYSPEERERGLTTLILAGSSVKASELTGIPDPRSRTGSASTARDTSSYKTSSSRASSRRSPPKPRTSCSDRDREAQDPRPILRRTDRRTRARKDKAATSRNLAPAALYIDKHSARCVSAQVPRTARHETSIRSSARWRDSSASTPRAQPSRGVPASVPLPPRAAS
jgi:hypothetical protein